MTTRFTWTAEAERRLVELWRAETPLSANAIGKLLGVTKSAVIGKAHRLGLAAQESPIRPAGAGATAPLERRVVAAQLPLVTAEAATAGPVAPQPPARPSKMGAARWQPVPARRSQVPADRPSPSYHKTCQWLRGDGPFTDADKCARPTSPGHSYCGTHCARVYVRPTDDAKGLKAARVRA
jgi:GcrA cell cycle regulator